MIDLETLTDDQARIRENGYRAGYEHGVQHALRAIARRGHELLAEELRNPWVREILAWRYASDSRPDRPKPFVPAPAPPEIEGEPIWDAENLAQFCLDAVVWEAEQRCQGDVT
jgi:hypothetical protein